MEHALHVYPDPMIINLYRLFAAVALTFLLTFTSFGSAVTRDKGSVLWRAAASDTLADSEATESLFIDFIASLPPGKEAKAGKVKALMAKAAAIPRNFILICDIADRLLADPESELRDDETYLLFLEEALDSPLLDGAEKERAEYRLETALKNKPGTKAADFNFIDIEGHTRSLHGMKTDTRLLLLFYDPDCNHCIDTINALKTTDLPDDISILAIDVAGDKKLWESAAGVIPDTWISGFATDPVEDSGAYIFQAMPTLFLLDKDKTVILKDTTVEKALLR